MKKILVISRDCFSQTNANGKTLESLLNSFKKDELMQFYTGVNNPDFEFCDSYFRVTDMQMMKSFFKKPVVTVKERTYSECLNAKNSHEFESKIWSSLRKINYNFAIRFLREILWKVSPNWRKRFYRWLEMEKPKAILYMVGDSFFLDYLVIEVAKRFKIPIILFNVEAYRIIDCKERSGFDRLYNYKSERSYDKLQKLSALTIYNCNIIKNSFQSFYSVQNENALIAYNAHLFDVENYIPIKGRCNIVYFGNLGVGRVSSIIEIADTIKNISPNKKIDVFGKASDVDKQRLLFHPNINYHGLVGQDVLYKVKKDADILLQVESFVPEITKKLKYAFSTKIAQCLCAGRALLSYAPIETASTVYLKAENAAVITYNKSTLREELIKLIKHAEYRTEYANKALATAKRNHNSVEIGKVVKQRIEQIL